MVTAKTLRSGSKMKPSHSRHLQIVSSAACKTLAYTRNNMEQYNYNNYGLGKVATVGVELEVSWTSALYIALAGMVIILCFFAAKRLL